MAVKRIGQDSVAELQPRVTTDKVTGEEKLADDYLWDDKLPGFGCKVTPQGAKVYVFQYRLGGRGHPTQRVTIGKASAMKAAVARGIAEELYSKVRQGESVAEKIRERKRVAVELAFDKFVEGYGKEQLKKRWPKSWKLALSRLETHAVGKEPKRKLKGWAPHGHLKSKPLPQITSDDISRLLAKLDDQPAARRSLFAALSFLFNRAVVDKIIPVSPVISVEAPEAGEDRNRVLNDDELRWLWAALRDEAENYRGVVEDLILTGQRRNEVAGLPWSELSRQRREWHLPAARSKNGCENIIPLTDRMVARLDALAGGDKWPRSGLVRKSREGTVLSGWSKMKRRLDASMAKAAKAAKAELPPWRLHDLRRTLATNMQRMRIDHEVVEHLLNHREKARTGIAKVYQVHGFGPEKRKALERWEAELDRILAGESATVVPFARPA